MRYFALASDYDGTLAHDGVVNQETLDALERLRKSGRFLILVTGREIDDLQRTFPHLDQFDVIVAENGALLYWPNGKEEKVLADPPNEKFVTLLRERGVAPLSVGRAIVATWESQAHQVLSAIRDLGLELQVAFNKGAVMVLPSSLNKASGLSAALAELALSSHNVVGVGDAENDHAFLKLVECAVAVSNALPSLKEEADLVTKGNHGQGVIELIDSLLKDDLQDLDKQMQRHYLLVGTRESGEEVRISPHGVNMLVAGTSGGGKSTLTTGLLERLAESSRQFCAIDPEGDYQAFEGAIIIGDTNRTPRADEVVGLLESPDRSVIVNLLGTPLDERPVFFESLLPKLQELRARTGRPHWIVVDEALHVLPASWTGTGETWPQELNSMMLITLAPDDLAPVILSSVDFLVAVGDEPEETIAKFCTKRGVHCPGIKAPRPLELGEAFGWYTRDGTLPFVFRVASCHTDTVRHARKYASADLTPDRSFFFRGPEDKLNLRASNLMTFVRMLEGVDDDTWLFHLRQGAYSQWFRENIKNGELAAEAQKIEGNTALGAQESRRLIQQEIEKRYTMAG